MITKENEASRLNEGKAQFSLIDFNMFKDMHKYFSHISIHQSPKDCMKEIIATVSTITHSDDEYVHISMLPVLQALSYKLSLLHEELPFYDTSLLDLRAFEHMAKVLENGMEKYDRNNWKKGYSNKFSTADSLYRHLRQMIIGEDIDDESKLPHIGHLMCNVMILTNDLLYVDRK